MVTQVSGEVEVVEENRVLRAFKAVDLVVERRMVTLEWVASPVNGNFFFLVLFKISSQVYISVPIFLFWFKFQICMQTQFYVRYCKLNPWTPHHMYLPRHLL
jgi:hypothetical protein